MSTFQTDSPQSVIDAFAKPAGQARLFTLPLDDFKVVFLELQKLHQLKSVDVVLNGDWALVQFTEMSNARIRVLPNSALERRFKRLASRRYLDQKDFEIAASVANFYGQRERLTLARFLKEELATNGMNLVLVFFLSGMFLMFIMQQSTTPEAILASASDVVIGIAAIFFSIFMLFTAAQSIPTIANEALFRSGLMHRFVQVDKYVSWMAILALLLASVSRVVASSQSLLNRSIQLGGQVSISTALVFPWVTAAAISLMLSALLSLVNYYSERIRYVYETELSKKLLDKRFDEDNE